MDARLFFPSIHVFFLHYLKNLFKFVDAFTDSCIFTMPHVFTRGKINFE